MLVLDTLYFGRVTYDASAELHFPAGLPGFEQENRFVSLQHPQYGPLVFLQSCRSRDLCFLSLPVQQVEANYSIVLSEDDHAILGVPADQELRVGRELLCLALLSLRPGEAPTANLLSPVVIHLATRRAVQSIQPHAEYSHQHALLGEVLAC